MLRLLARSLVHKHADPTGVIHRRHLGGKTGRSRVIVGANVFAGGADPGTRGVARGSVWGVTCPTTTGAAGFGSQSEGSVMRTRWLVAGVLAAVCSVALAACTLFPYAVGMSGVVYLAAAVVLNAIFLRYGWMIHKHYSDQVARKAFAWSIVYLSLLFAALLVDHYVKHYLPF